MDDITIYGGTFGDFLANLETVLNRCIEKNLVLSGRSANSWYIKELSLDLSSPTRELTLIKTRLSLFLSYHLPQMLRQ